MDIVACDLNGENISEDFTKIIPKNKSNRV